MSRSATSGPVGCAGSWTISDGKLAFNAAFSGFKGETKCDGGNVLIGVNPGIYQVDVYVYLPCATAAAIQEEGDQDFMVAKWWRESRGNEDCPDWVANAVFEDTAQDDDEHAAYWDKRSEEDFDTIYERLYRGDECAFLDFVIYLTPAAADVEDSSPADRHGFLVWNKRKLDVCPLGVVNANFD